MSNGAYINEEGTLVVDMAEADKLWNSLTNDQQFAAMSAMFDPLLKRAKELSEEVEAQAARIRELEAAQDDHALMAAYQRGYLDGRAAPVAVSEAARERVARAICEAREELEAPEVLDSDYYRMADAALRAIAEGGE